jgi:ABC-2 type transport system ATP-binding protein
MNMLKVRNLRKRYTKAFVVDDVSFDVNAGEIVALLGVNGAGKTTTLKSIIGVIKPTTGTITVNDISVTKDPQGAKMLMGSVPDRAWYYPKTTAFELLKFVATVKGVVGGDGEIEGLLRRFDLWSVRDSLTESYSHGMRQRLAFCVALLGAPQLLVVDEPMVGLDVRGHADVKRLFREVAAENRAVLLTTHTLSVAEELATRIIVMNAGKVIADGTLDELRVASGEGGSLEDVFMTLTNETQPNQRTQKINQETNQETNQEPKGT